MYTGAYDHTEYDGCPGEDCWYERVGDTDYQGCGWDFGTPAPAPGPSTESAPAPGPSTEPAPAPGPAIEEPHMEPFYSEPPAPAPSMGPAPAPAPGSSMEPAPPPNCTDPLDGPNAELPWADFVSCAEEKAQGACEDGNEVIAEGCPCTCGGAPPPADGPAIEEPHMEPFYSEPPAPAPFEEPYMEPF
eukprot:SAG11_NODE_2109_length_3809_cov_2.690027_1_plen_188_part_00